MKLSTLSDLGWTELLNSGDDKAFSFIYHKYWPKLYSIALSRMRDIHEAEDIVQDIYARLWKNREKLIIETDLERYLSGAVKFEIINRVSKIAKVSAYLRRVGTNMSLIDRLDIHQRMDLQCLLSDVDQTIEALPKKCRIVFNLSRKKHLSHRTIAKQLQISEKTVQKHITSALKTLREKYASRL